MPAEEKEKALLGFSDGEIQVLVTKPRIAGFGMNWQHCNRMAFVGLSDSWEQYHQAVRRCWRFGQTKPVQVDIIVADTEGAVLENIRRKQAQNDEMQKEMVAIMRDYTVAEIKGAKANKADYLPSQSMEIPAWML
jgi:SNF2 family DNA or RNA helicase